MEGSLAQLLFFLKHARTDLQITVAILYTRVMSPNVGYNKKLRRILLHLGSTIFLVLTLGWNVTGNINWSVDPSFVVYHDIRSHTGEVMSFGTGALITM